MDFSQYSRERLLEFRKQVNEELAKRKKEKFYIEAENEINKNGYYVDVPDEKLDTLYSYRSVAVPVIITSDCRSMDQTDMDENMRYSDIDDKCNVPEEFIGKLNKIKKQNIIRTSEWTCNSYDDPYKAKGQIQFNVYYKPKSGLCYDLNGNREVYIYDHNDKYFLYVKTKIMSDNVLEVNDDLTISNFEVGKDIDVFGDIFKFYAEIANYTAYIPIG
jgi:hypothetical protein